MEKLKGIIFDFDGVICESVEAKTEAIRKLFEDYPEHIEAIVKVHMDNGGMSRYRKFEIIYRDILKSELSEEKSQELGQLFTNFSHKEVVESSYVGGAEEFLERYHQDFLLFVVSGTPQEEMDSVIDDRNMRHYFQGIFGTPRLKHELVNLILNKYSLSKDEVLFVGDSINDQQGAQTAGIRFIGRLHEQYENPFKDVSERDLICNLNDLELLIDWQYERV